MLNDFILATEMANVKVKYGQLRMWHVEYLKKYWIFYELVLKQHHENINDIISSWMSEKVAMSTVLVAEQERIIQHVSQTKELISCLSVDNSTLAVDLDCIVKNLNELRDVFTRHFTTQKEGMLTTIHKCFSQHDFKKVQDRLMTSFHPLGYGWLLYGLDTNNKRNKWLKNVVEASVVKRWTVLSNDYPKFDKHTRKLLIDIMTSH
jgi:hypothetical protein